MFPRNLLFALLVGLFAATSGFAADMRGVISKVDAVKGELVIDGLGKGGKGMSYVFTMTDDTSILFGSKAGSRDDLLVGKRVRVTYDERDGKQTAQVIRPSYPQPKSKPTNTLTNASQAGGILRLINSNDREIVVVGGNANGGEAETTLHVPKHLKIQRNSKATDFDDLKEGEPLSFEAEKKDGKSFAKALSVGRSDPNAKKGPPSRPEEMKSEKVIRVLETVIEVLEQMRRDHQ